MRVYTHTHTRTSLSVPVCVCCLIHLAGNASCFGHGFSFGLRQAEKNRDRSLYLHNLALAACLSLSLSLSRSLLLYLSRRLAFLFRTCKLFAFCLIPYTYAHKLSWVYVLNFTSHVKAVQGLLPPPTPNCPGPWPGALLLLHWPSAACCVHCSVVVRPCGRHCGCVVGVARALARLHSM